MPPTQLYPRPTLSQTDPLKNNHRNPRKRRRKKMYSFIFWHLRLEIKRQDDHDFLWGEIQKEKRSQQHFRQQAISQATIECSFSKSFLKSSRVYSQGSLLDSFSMQSYFALIDFCLPTQSFFHSNTKHRISFQYWQMQAWITIVRRFLLLKNSNKQYFICSGSYLLILLILLWKNIKCRLLGWSKKHSRLRLILAGKLSMLMMSAAYFIQRLSLFWRARAQEEPSSLPFMMQKYISNLEQWQMMSLYCLDLQRCYDCMRSPFGLPLGLFGSEFSCYSQRFRLCVISALGFDAFSSFLMGFVFLTIPQLSSCLYSGCSSNSKEEKDGELSSKKQLSSEFFFVGFITLVCGVEIL